ncbi:MAG: SDR family oxidoreductase [Mycobacteriales bacterium]
MEERTKVAVAGATGRVGRHVVDVLAERGHDAVPMSRSTGVDLVTGEGLADALAGVRIVIDAASTPSPDEEAATRYFTTATANLHEAGARAGVQRLVVVSIIGLDKFATGYGAAKLAHERAALDGPVPARILRAAQFHEFVGQLVDWGRQGEVAYVPRMRTQLVAARAVAEALVDLAFGAGGDTDRPAEFPEIAGPREENLAAMAALLVARRGDAVKIEEVSDPKVAETEVWENGGLLPGPHAALAGPTFEEWLDTAHGDSR